MAQITLIFKACLVFNNNYYYYYNNITYTYNSHWLQTHCYACVSNKNVFCLFLKVLTVNCTRKGEHQPLYYFPESKFISCNYAKCSRVDSLHTDQPLIIAPFST